MMETDKEVFGSVIVVTAQLATTVRDKLASLRLPHSHKDIVDAIGVAMLGTTLWDNDSVRSQYSGPLSLLVQEQLRPKTNIPE
jgi:hypothetical protein